MFVVIEVIVRKLNETFTTRIGTKTTTGFVFWLPDIKCVLLSGLTKMSPHCPRLSCLVSSCPTSAEPQHFCESLLGRGVISQAGYPRQLSSNYISFSRRAPCHPAQHFSRPHCPPGWSRHHHQCLLQLNTAQSYNNTVEDCKARGGRLAFPNTARQRETYLELLEDQTLWVLNLRSLNLTKALCPALVAGQTQFRTPGRIS